MMNHSSSSKRAPKMDSIDETSVLESTSTVATVDSPSRSINTSSSSCSESHVSVSEEEALHRQLQLIEEAEVAHTTSRARYLQEEVLENPHKPVPPLIFKYILIGMGLCGVLIGIVLGAIIGQHLLKQSHQNATRHMNPPSLDDNNSTAATTPPSPAAPTLVWYYPPTPAPSSDIFNRTPTFMRTAYPTTSTSSTVMPTTNSSSSFHQNETSATEEEEDKDVQVNETNVNPPPKKKRGE